MSSRTRTFEKVVHHLSSALISLMLMNYQTRGLVIIHADPLWTNYSPPFSTREVWLRAYRRHNELAQGVCDVNSVRTKQSDGCWRVCSVPKGWWTGSKRQKKKARRPITNGLHQSLFSKQSSTPRLPGLIFPMT
jgi:hypothetical protein